MKRLVLFLLVVLFALGLPLLVLGEEGSKLRNPLREFDDTPLKMQLIAGCQNDASTAVGVQYIRQKFGHNWLQYLENIQKYAETKRDYQKQKTIGLWVFNHFKVNVPLVRVYDKTFRTCLAFKKQELEKFYEQQKRREQENEQETRPRGNLPEPSGEWRGDSKEEGLRF